MKKKAIFFEKCRKCFIPADSYHPECGKVPARTLGDDDNVSGSAEAICKGLPASDTIADRPCTVRSDDAIPDGHPDRGKYWKRGKPSSRCRSRCRVQDRHGKRHPMIPAW